MNMASEILHFAGEMEAVTLKEAMESLSCKISNLKESVSEYFVQCYVELFPVINGTSSLTATFSQLLEDANELKDRLESETCEVLKGKTDMDGLFEQCALNQCQLSLLDSVLAFDLEIREGFRSMELGLFSDSSEHTEKAEALLEDILEFFEEDLRLQVMSTAPKSIDDLKSQLLQEVQRKWEECIVIEEKEKSFSLSISPRDLKSLLKAVGSLYPSQIDKLCEWILKLVEEVIMFESVVSIRAKEKMNILKVVVDKKPSQNFVEKVHEVFMFLSDSLNYLIDEKVSFLERFGAIAGGRVLEAIVKRVRDKIPTNREGQVQFRQFLERVQNLDDILKDLKVVGNNEDSLENLWKNIEEVHIQKVREELLKSGRDIIKESIQETVQVGVLPKKEIVPKIDELMKLDEVPDRFEFPACLVSSSVEKFVELVSVILEDITSEPDARKAQVEFFTARDIIQLYADLSPFVHRSSHESDPRDAVILHNNLMFIAHDLVRLEVNFVANYPSQLAALQLSLMDLVDNLRRQAEHILDQEVQKQASILKEIICTSELVRLSDLEKLPPSVEDSLNKCLRLLSGIGKSWRPILPYNIYCRLISLLSHCFLKEVIARVLGARDIQAEAGNQLVLAFASVQEGLPKLYEVPGDIVRNLKLWSKFNELVIILGASLVEIGERWADGKGPLADCFNPSEVQQLIRALFQVSERRAVILSRIH